MWRGRVWRRRASSSGDGRSRRSWRTCGPRPSCAGGWRSCWRRGPTRRTRCACRSGTRTRPTWTRAATPCCSCSPPAGATSCAPTRGGSRSWAPCRTRGTSAPSGRAAPRRSWRDERTLDVLWSELARRLDSAYAGAPSGPALERARATLFGWARGQLTGPVGQGLETYDWRWFAGAPLNNAVVIAQRLYRMNLNLFDAVYLQNNAEIAETIRAIQVRDFTQPDRDPYKALYSRPGVPGED